MLCAIIAVAEFRLVALSVGTILVTQHCKCLSERGMNQFFKPTVACLAVLGMFGMQGLCAQDDPDRTAALQLTTDHSGRSLHIDGDAAALHVVVQQTTIADVLSALAGFNVRYRLS